jgi:hypothetical protein
MYRSAMKKGLWFSGIIRKDITSSSLNVYSNEVSSSLACDLILQGLSANSRGGPGFDSVSTAREITI